MLIWMQFTGLSFAWELALAIALALGLTVHNAQPEEEDFTSEELMDAMQEEAASTPEPEAALVAEETPKMVAAGAADVLAPSKPTPLVLPSWLVEKIKGRTAIFYFSPLCSHCQDAMPAINELVQRESLDWLGVATTGTPPQAIASFKTEYKASFEMLQDDADRHFADAVMARSTPSVYVVSPADPAQGHPPNTVIVHERYAPFSPGSSGVFSIRENPTDPFKHFDGYVGVGTCGACHTQETRSWAMTHHAVAYRTLYTREKADDPKCVGCHVTGMGEPGGFVMGDHGSDMRDVTCEACHGAGGPHSKTAKVQDPKAQCVTCHDAEHSIAFTVEKGLPHIDHFIGNRHTDDQVRERIMAMIDGEAPRPLLAFPEGPTLGAKACKSCHSESHKSWKKSPHGRAMATLKGEDKTKLECVRCHATPTSFGSTQPTELSQYRTSESVGCESCHGAGEAHAANPTKDNIVGLGESCPECVIEAVCTSCHTPKWDPDWELQGRLEAARHP